MHLRVVEVDLSEPNWPVELLLDVADDSVEVFELVAAWARVRACTQLGAALDWFFPTGAPADGFTVPTNNPHSGGRCFAH